MVWPEGSSFAKCFGLHHCLPTNYSSLEDYKNKWIHGIDAQRKIKGGKL
jgi:hypothetical protein